MSLDLVTDADVLLASEWAGNSSAVRLMALHLVRIRLGASESAFDGCASFFEDWLKAEGLRLGQKTGGKKCKRLIVEPVLRWWLDVSPNQKRIEDVVGALHLPLALLLAKEIDRVSWLVSSQMRQNKL